MDWDSQNIPFCHLFAMYKSFSNYFSPLLASGSGIPKGAVAFDPPTKAFCIYSYNPDSLLFAKLVRVQLRDVIESKVNT